MDSLEKTLLTNEIKFLLSKVKITSDNLKQVTKDERENFVEMKLLEANDTLLKWALEKKVISYAELSIDEFYTENNRLSGLIAAAGLGTVAMGAAGSYFAYNATLATVTTLLPGIPSLALAILPRAVLPFVTTTTTVVTSTTIMATAAPIALACAGIYGVVKYKENQEIKKFIEYFEKEKDKISKFYLDKVDGLEKSLH